MEKLLLATQNPGKIKELKALLPDNIELLRCEDVGVIEEIPETGETLAENAAQKALFLFEKSGIPSLADDTGLEVNALQGAPGVYSARYAGPEKNNQKNIEKLLNELKGSTDRSAQFRTVIALADVNGVRLFEGIVKGEISLEKTGDGGFGYDPVFVPEGGEKSFAEISAEEKNKISHRGRALQAFLAFWESEP